MQNYTDHNNLNNLNNLNISTSVDISTTSTQHYTTVNPQDPDDGVEAVLKLLDAESPCDVPCTPPPRINSFLTTWRTSHCTQKRSSPPSPPPSSISPLAPSSSFSSPSLSSLPPPASSPHLPPCNPHASLSLNRTLNFTSKLKPRHNKISSSDSSSSPWSFREDCLLADIFTSLAPKFQPAEIAKKLSSRTWNEAKLRFHYLCRHVCSKRTQFRRKSSTDNDSQNTNHSNTKNPDVTSNSGDNNSSLSFNSRCTLRLSPRSPINKPISNLR